MGLSRFIFISLFFLFSCSDSDKNVGKEESGCDVSTAESAAGCMCELNKQYGINYTNEKKRIEIEKEFETLKKKVEEKVKKGNYTMESVYQIIDSRSDCEN